MRKNTLAACLALTIASPLARAEEPPPPRPAEIVPLIQSLHRKLSDADPAVRREAANALGRIAHDLPSAASGLAFRLLYDPDPTVRVAAASALADMGRMASTVVPQLTKALASKDEKVRCYAAITLTQIGPLAKDALPVLVKAVKDKNPRMRRLALGALGALGLPAKKLVPILLEAINDPDEGEAKRMGAVWVSAIAGLGGLGPEAKEAVPTLLKVVQAGGVKASWALRAVAQIAPDENTLAITRKFLNGKDIVMRRVAASALADMGPAARPAVPDLLKALKAEGVVYDGDARALKVWVLSAFEKMGPAAKEAVPALVKEMEAGDKELSPLAFRALKTIAPGDERLLAMLKRALKSTDEGARYDAVKRLGELGANARPAVPDLAEILKGNTPLRHAVLTVLENMGPAAKDAVPALRELASSRNRSVRLRAEAALKKIEGGK